MSSREKKKALTVRILNSVTGCGLTSRKHAERYIRRGMARWVEDGRCIEFLARCDDHRQSSVEHSLQLGYDRAAGTGMAGLTELANLPMINPGVVLGIGRRKGASRHTFLASKGF